MKYKEVNKYFSEIEKDLGLFNWRIKDIPVWELIRFDVFNSIMHELGLYGQAHPSRPSPFSGVLRKLLDIVQSLFIKNPFFAPKRAVVFIGHPRRKKMHDGLYHDIYCDSFVEDTEGAVLFEQKYYGRHLCPAKTKPIYYLDFLSLLTFNISSILKLNNLFAVLDDQTIISLEKAILCKFNVQVCLRRTILDKVSFYQSQLFLFVKLYKYISPKALFVVVSYGHKPLIAAAKILRIPVIELQHGVINAYHVGYTYPKGVKPIIFPDLFFSFGVFWRDISCLPMPSEKIIAIGYNHLEQAIAKNLGTSKEELMVFISQGTVGKQLSLFAVQLRALTPAHIRIVYKLHPGEFGRWKKEYSRLEESGIEICEYHEPDLYEILAKAKWQIGVCSTALFEGIAFRCNTYLVNLPGVEYMRPLMNARLATLVSTPGEVIFEYKKDQVDKSYFFADHPKDNFRKALSKVVNIR